MGIIEEMKLELIEVQKKIIQDLDCHPVNMADYGKHLAEERLLMKYIEKYDTLELSTTEALMEIILSKDFNTIKIEKENENMLNVFVHPKNAVEHIVIDFTINKTDVDFN